jgi:hypothetical protein
MAFGDKDSIGGIKWPLDERDPDTIETKELAWYECSHCRARWSDFQRDKAVKAGGWQASGRVETRHVMGLILGASAAHGFYLDRELEPAVARAVANQEPRDGLRPTPKFRLLAVRASASTASAQFRSCANAAGRGMRVTTMSRRCRLAPASMLPRQVGSPSSGPWGSRLAPRRGMPASSASRRAGWSVTGTAEGGVSRYNRRDMADRCTGASRGREATAWF